MLTFIVKYDIIKTVNTKVNQQKGGRKLAKICIPRFFNGLHSELSRKGFELFDKTRGAIALLSQAKIATTNHYQGLDTAIFPWLEGELKNSKSEIGKGKFAHVLSPFLSLASLSTQNGGNPDESVDVDFLPEFAVSRAEEIVGKYFYVLTGKNFCPEHSEISKNFSVSCPGGKIGLLMNEDLWGGLEKAFYAFMVNPKSKSNQQSLLSAIQSAEDYKGFPYIIWPMDAEVYAIGSAYGFGAMEEFCELIVKNQLSEIFAPISQCLDFAAQAPQEITYYPHRDLAKWFRHHEQLAWFQTIAKLEYTGSRDYWRIIFQIAANSDYASAVRWRNTGLMCLEGCLYADGSIGPHFIGGSEDVIAIQEAAIRSLEKSRLFSLELLKAPDCTLRQRMRNFALKLEKIKFE